MRLDTPTGGTEFRKVVNDVLTESTCTVRCAWTDPNTPHAISIRFTGPAARFPSTSNNQKILFHGKGKRMSVGHSNKVIGRMYAARQLYILALMERGITPPTFGDARVFVQVALVKDRWIRDSHNYAKPICDWLQAVGVVNNDSQIECHCFKRHEYGNETAATEVLIVQRAVVQRCLSEFVSQVRHATHVCG